MRAVNADGLSLIKSFEGFRAQAYQDEEGIWTIGYGHTREVTMATPDITEDEAENLLRIDMASAEALVEHLITVGLNDNQYSALVSLVFNAGATPLTHTLGNLLNAGDYRKAANEFLRWNHSGGKVLDGLTRRRIAERQLFIS